MVSRHTGKSNLLLVLCKVSARLDNIDIRHLGSSLWIFGRLKTQRGDPYKMSKSMLSNLAETLHSSAKFKNKQTAKIWGL